MSDLGDLAGDDVVDDLVDALCTIKERFQPYLDEMHRLYDEGASDREIAAVVHRFGEDLRFSRAADERALGWDDYDQ